jgi:hypothetical protein
VVTFLDLRMLGSQPGEFPAPAIQPEHIYSVDIGGRRLWGWTRLDREGVHLGSSEQLFMDYVSCFCDAQRGIDDT